MWTFKSISDYYIEKESVVKEDSLIFMIKSALLSNGYRIHSIIPEEQCILAKRGLRGNEWNTRAGVYYKIENNIKIIFPNIGKQL